MSEKPSRLGRGLAALIGDMAPIEAPRQADNTNGQRRLPVEFLIANRANPRRDFDTDQRLSWAGEILKKPRPPRTKMTALFETAKEHLRRR